MRRYNILKTLFATLAVAAFFAVPASAMTHEDCGYEMDESAPPPAHHHEAAAPHKEHRHAIPATVEEIPMGSVAAAKGTCPHHPGEPCHCQHHLVLGGGCALAKCCYRPDTPLTGGLKDSGFSDHETGLIEAASDASPAIQKAFVDNISPSLLKNPLTPEPRPPHA